MEFDTEQTEQLEGRCLAVCAAGYEHEIAMHSKQTEQIEGKGFAALAAGEMDIDADQTEHEGKGSEAYLADKATREAANITGEKARGHFDEE